MVDIPRIFEKAIDFVDRGRIADDYLPQGPVLVGTYHKTGTVWLRDIFLKISRKTGLPFTVSYIRDFVSTPHIYFHEESSFDPEIMDAQYFRGVHLIRDPRDIAVSGMFYHKKAKEPWLHQKYPEFNGMTYQEKINSYDNLDEQLLFEIENAALRNTNLMKEWDYSNNNFIEIKYENLINDSNLELFHDIFVFLGFRSEAILKCLNIAYGKSLFSQKKKKTSHIRSGKTRQWEKYFKPKHKKKFYALHGDLLVRLGYEEDDAWLND